MRRLGNLYGATGGGFAGMVYDSSEDAPSLNCCQGGGRQPHIMEIIVLGNYMPSNYDSSRVVDGGGIAPTVKENHGTVTATVEVTDVTDNSSEQR